MTNTNSVIERLAAAAEKAAAAGDHGTHAALHTTEMKLRELWLCLLCAEKVVTGAPLYLLRIVRVILEAA